MKKFLFPVFIVAISLVYAAPLLVQAQGLADPGNFGLPDLSSSGNRTGMAGLIENIVKILLMFSAVIAVLFVIIGGMQYILSGANEDLAKRGKTTVTNAVIGLIIIILSYTVVTVITSTFTRPAGQVVP